MPHDQIIAVAVLAGAILLFIRDSLRPDIVGICAVLALLFSGVLTPKEAFAGFSDPLVVLLAALFVVSGGLEAAGVTRAIADRLGPIAGTNPARVHLVLVIITLLLSSVLSSTGTVALMLPVALDLANRAGISPSRLLIPLAYAAGLGGTLTLVSTPPNLVASEALHAAGFQPFGFFSLTPVGSVMTAVGVGMLVVGNHFLPDRRAVEVSEALSAPKRPLDRRGLIALGIMVAMIALLVWDVLPTVTTVLMAAAALGLSRCVPPGDIYRHVPVNTVVLVATMLSMSTALMKTGAIGSLVSLLSGMLVDQDARLIIATLYLITSVIGLAISNTATAVLLAPVALGIAQGTGIDARCLLATVALAASCSFATPISTPMNTLVMEPGRYRFTDYVRIGLPLQIVLGIIVVLMVPMTFPPHVGAGTPATVTSRSAP